MKIIRIINVISTEKSPESMIKPNVALVKIELSDDRTVGFSRIVAAVINGAIIITVKHFSEYVLRKF